MEKKITRSKKVSNGEIYNRVKKGRKLQRKIFCLFLMAAGFLDGLFERSYLKNVKLDLRTESKAKHKGVQLKRAC